jgi:hypothetical protein
MSSTDGVGRPSRRVLAAVKSAPRSTAKVDKPDKAAPAKSAAKAEAHRGHPFSTEEVGTNEGVGEQADRGQEGHPAKATPAKAPRQGHPSEGHPTKAAQGKAAPAKARSGKDMSAREHA